MSGPPPLPGEAVADALSGQRSALAEEWALYWRGSLIWSFLLGATLALGVPQNQWAAAGIVLFMAFGLYPLFLLIRWAFKHNMFMAVVCGVLFGMSPVLALLVAHIFLALSKLITAQKQFWFKLLAALLIYGLAVGYVMVVPRLASDAATVGEQAVDTNEYSDESSVAPEEEPAPVAAPAPVQETPVAPVEALPLPAPVVSAPVIEPMPPVAAPLPEPVAAPAPVAAQPARKPKPELSAADRNKLENDIAAARMMLRTTGVIKRGGEYMALVNDQVLGKGDMIPVVVKGKTYTFVIAEIDAKNVSFEPVIDQ